MTTKEQIMEFMRNAKQPVDMDTIYGATLLMDEIEFNQTLIKMAQRGEVEFSFETDERDLEHMLTKTGLKPTGA